MASSQGTVDCILEQIEGPGRVSARRMFGEYGLYCGGTFVALVCDDQLYVKPTEAGRRHAGEIGEGAPYPRAKPHMLVPSERWDDAEWLAALIRISAAALPAAAPRGARPNAGAEVARTLAKQGSRPHISSTPADVGGLRGGGLTSPLDGTRPGRMYSDRRPCPRLPGDAGARLVVSISPRP
ncbi:MAG TPA: TfoX/Sxy family protein [Microvirga sp.]|jgi:TfoX/Sxy family transcriptional regulator of competence genes|nr:TfoX/Sxy family protein [Microvirga sp.]